MPARPRYFAGLSLPAPPRALAAARYDLRACVSAPYDHRHEEWLPARGRSLRLDCCRLAAAGFPFVVGGGGGGENLLVAGAAGEGQHRVLDMTESAKMKERGGEDDDAEAVPLVLAAAAEGEGREVVSAARTAALAVALLSSLASVAALAWWLPGRAGGGVTTSAGRPRSPVRGAGR